MFCFLFVVFVFFFFKQKTAYEMRISDWSSDVCSSDLSRRDEIGEMAKAVQVFKVNAVEMKRLEAEQVAQKQRAEAERRSALNQMADAFETSVRGIVDTLSAASTELQVTAQSMSGTADETAQRSNAAAAASEQASAGVHTVAAAAEELSAR